MPRRKINSKRRLIDPPCSQAELDQLAARVVYIGSPYHKRNPGDFALMPPSQPRPDKTLCDGAGIFRKDEAQKLLAAGARKGTVSPFEGDGFPKHIWAVTEAGIVLEAKYNNEGPGNYHGYPLPGDDRFREAVLARWNGR